MIIRQGASHVISGAALEIPALQFRTLIYVGRVVRRTGREWHTDSYVAFGQICDQIS